MEKLKPFSIDVKGGGKASKRRKCLLKDKQRRSWRKHWSIAINAKRGRPLEIFSLMAMEHKGVAPRQGSKSDLDEIVVEKESKVAEATRGGFI